MRPARVAALITSLHADILTADSTIAHLFPGTLSVRRRRQGQPCDAPSAARRCAFVEPTADETLSVAATKWVFYKGGALAASWKLASPRRIALETVQAAIISEGIWLQRIDLRRCYLNLVKSGEEVVVTSHRHPVARILLATAPSAGIVAPARPVKDLRQIKGIKPRPSVSGVQSLPDEGRRR